MKNIRKNIFILRKKQKYNKIILNIYYNNIKNYNYNNIKN